MSELTPRIAYLIEEYRHHAGRMAARQDLRFQLVRFSLAGTAGYFAAVLSPVLALRDTPGFGALLWLPVAFNLPGLVLTLGISRSVRGRGAYIARIEETLLEPGEGWQRHGQTGQGWPPRPIATAVLAFWSGMVACSAAVAIWAGQT